MFKNSSYTKYILLFTFITTNFVCSNLFAFKQNIRSNSIYKSLKELEISSGGRIGLFVINTADNTYLEYRSKEYFPFESTFKVIVVSAILKRSMTDKRLLQEKIAYTKKDLVYYSPITEKYLSEGMTISNLCGAAIMHSDNTATNLLIKKLGGLEDVNSFAHSIGNKTFKLDSFEPKLNSNPNDQRDSSTAYSMGLSLYKLSFGEVLALPQREQLLIWLKANTTGDTRIRSGLPNKWIVADKTGTGNSYGVTNDIAIIWPPNASPIIMAIYFSTQGKNDSNDYDDVIALVSRKIINSLH